MTLEKMWKRRKELVKQVRALADKSNDSSYEWSDSDESEWTESNAAIDKLARQITAKEYDSAEDTRMIGREDKMGIRYDSGGNVLQEPKKHSGEHFRDTQTGRVVPVVRGNDSFATAVASMRGHDEWAGSRDGFDGLSVGRMLRCLATGAQGDAERRALSEGSDSAGGYTVPDILSTQLIDLMRTKTRVMQAGASMIPLNSDRNSFAKLLTDPTPGWRSELSSVATSDPTLGLISFQPRSLAVLVRVSQELLEDSVNVENALQNAIAQSLASEVDRVCLVGTGASNEPQGLANMSGGINEVSMGANGAAVADFTDLLDAIKLLQDDNAGEVGAAIMNPRTMRVYAGLADTTGQPLRRPFTIESLPFLETSQVPITQTMGTETDASSIYLGDWSDLVVGMRSTLKIEVLKERYADTLEIGFLAHMRLDVAAWHEQSLARIVGVIPA